MSVNNGLKINPETKDYEIVDGKPVVDKSIKQPAYIRLVAKRNTWLYAPDDKWGSDFHLLKKTKTTEAATREINTAEKALEPLLDDNRASDITIEVTGRLRGATQLSTKIVEQLGEQEESLLIPVGE